MKRALPATIAATLCIGVVVVLAANKPAATAATTTSSRLDSTGDVTACSTGGTQLSGTPSGNNFIGANYNGKGATLPSGTYHIGSNTCVQNYVLTGSKLTFNSGTSTATVVNNTFQNTSAITGILANTSNVNILYNTFKNNGGVISDGPLDGTHGTTTNLKMDHNDMEGTPRGEDGTHLQCFSAPCTNISISYNKFVNIGRYGFELQGVVHGAALLHNYVSLIFNQAGDNSGAGGGGQLSISNTGEQNGIYAGTPSSTGIELAYNTIIQNIVRGDCWENAGSGNNNHDNYCKNFSHLTDWKNTNDDCQNRPWFVTNNIIIGTNRTTGLSEPEAFNGTIPNNPCGKAITPTESGNRSYNVGDTTAPPAPAWNYANGVQPNTGSGGVTPPSTGPTPTPTKSSPTPAPTSSAPTSAPTTSSAPVASGALLGTSSVGASSDNAGAGARFGNIYTATTSSTVRDFRIYAGGHGGQFVPILYSVSSTGTIGSLVAYGAPVTLGANQAAAWVTDSVVKAGRVTAGSRYLVGVFTKPGGASGSVQLRYNAGSALDNHYIQDGSNYLAPPAAWGNGGGTAAHSGYSVYLEENA